MSSRLGSATAAFRPHRVAPRRARPRVRGRRDRASRLHVRPLLDLRCLRWQARQLRHSLESGAIGAVAFATIASQCTAAPLDSGVAAADAADAIEQFGASHVLLFAGTKADGLLAAIEAAAATVRVHIATPRMVKGAASGLFDLAGQGDEPAQVSNGLPVLAAGAEDVVLLLRKTRERLN